MPTPLSVDDLFRAVARSWWVLAGTLVLCLVAALGVWIVFPQTYTAEAQHTVEPISVLSTGSTFNTVNMDTEAVVATSTSVVARAAEALDGDTSTTQLRASVRITVPRGSQVLVFSVTTDNAQKSADWANALATAYGEQRSATARAVVDDLATDLDKAIKDLQAVYQAQPENSAERAATQLKLQALLDQQARLTSTPFFAGLLVTPAAPPVESNRPGLAVFLAAGLVLGLLAGSVAALATSRVRGAHTGRRWRSASVTSRRHRTPTP